MERGSPEIQGRIVGAASKLGHMLRNGQFPEPAESTEQDVVIVGGGMAGLSAAWKLQKSGIADFALFELESDIGGNARWTNSVSAYPWGAHYVPLLTQESKAARIVEDLGIITGYKNGLPVYDEYYLCADPHERLYMYGRWHDGFVPQTGVTAADQDQHRAFFAAMDRFKSMLGKDGRRAFSIPVDLSSRDPAITRYDALASAVVCASKGGLLRP